MLTKDLYYIKLKTKKSHWYTSVAFYNLFL